MSHLRTFCISVETVLIRIVSNDHMELTQGRPFGFEVECVTADGEPTQGQRFVFLHRQVLQWLWAQLCKLFKVTQL